MFYLKIIISYSLSKSKFWLGCFRSGLVLIDTAAVPVRSIAIGDISGSMNKKSVLQSRSLVLSNSQDNISTSMNKLFEISVCLRFAWQNLEHIILEAIMVAPLRLAYSNSQNSNTQPFRFASDKSVLAKSTFQNFLPDKSSPRRSRYFIFSVS